MQHLIDFQLADMRCAAARFWPMNDKLAARIGSPTRVPENESKCRHAAYDYVDVDRHVVVNKFCSDPLSSIGA